MPDMMIKVPSTGRELDLSKALPLTIGDLRKLSSKGVKLADLQGGSPSFDVIFALFDVVFTKVAPDITVEEIDSIPSDALGKLMEAVRAADEPDPSSSSS